METIRIFGGKSRAADKAVDVSVESGENTTESLPPPEPPPQQEPKRPGLVARLQPKRLAMWAFLATLAIVILTSANYFMVRNEARAAELPPLPPPPRPAGPPVPNEPIQAAAEVHTLPVPIEAPPPAPPPFRVAQADQPLVAEVTPAPAAANPPPTVSATPTPAPAPAPVPVPPVAVAVAPPRRALPVTNAPPIIGKWYLQLGSLEKGVAEVIVQGLQARGMNAVWGQGITDRLGRVLVGPYDSLAQAELTRKQVQDLGFRPFAKYITTDDFKPKISGTPEAAAAIAESMRQQALQDERERLQQRSPPRK